MGGDMQRNKNASKAKYGGAQPIENIAEITLPNLT